MDRRYQSIHKHARTTTIFLQFKIFLDITGLMRISRFSYLVTRRASIYTKHRQFFNWTCTIYDHETETSLTSGNGGLNSTTGSMNLLSTKPGSVWPLIEMAREKKQPRPNRDMQLAMARGSDARLYCFNSYVYRIYTWYSSRFAMMLSCYVIMSFVRNPLKVVFCRKIDARLPGL